MLETPHVIVGAAIATKVANPALALPLAFASHFLLEKVPHWNPHLNTETEKFGRPTKNTTVIVFIDSAVALATGLYIASRALPNSAHAMTIVLACLLAALPDLIEAPHFFLGIRNGFIKKWMRWQKSMQVDAEIIPGLLTQAVTVIAAFWWILS